MNHDLLKKEVHNYWNKESCGTWITKKAKFSKEYFDEIEQYRYTVEPIIFSFAQFTRFHGKKILEVGTGAGTDFLQWVRAGTDAFGIDLTQEAIENTKKRLECYNLKAADLKCSDAENLPFPDDTFDLVYSWGVIHHSPDTQRCLQEIIRVAKPGGIIKIMIYNKYSVYAIAQYMRSGLLKGKIFKAIDEILYYQQESLGTKAFSLKKMKKIISAYPVTIKNLHAPMSKNDFLSFSRSIYRFFAYAIACFIGWNRAGWFMMIELQKNGK